MDATLEPIRRGGNRANVPLIPPLKYSDDLWLKDKSGPQGRDYQVETLRLLINMNKGSRLYGPFRVPNLHNHMNIIGAFCAPFKWATDFTKPVTEDDTDIIRPAVAVRSKDVLHLMLAPITNVEGYPGALIDNTGITPVIDVFSARRMMGDFFTDYARPYAEKGAHPSDQIKGCTVLHVLNDGVDPDDPLYTIYKIQLNQGTRLRLSILTADPDIPTVGTPWPEDQFETRFGYEIGRMQFRMSRLYAKRNMYPVPSISPLPDHNQNVTDNSNPHTISAVRVAYDLPDNPTTQIKKITLNDGSTVKRPYATVTNIGLEIGQATGTGSLQETMLDSEWAEIEMLLILAPDVDGQNGDAGSTKAGLELDPWGFWECLTASTSTGTGTGGAGTGQGPR